MRYATVLSLYVVAMYVTADLVTGISARKLSNKKIQATRAFHPCRVSIKMSLALTQRLTKLAISTLSMCGLKVASLVSYKWGSIDHIHLLIPKVFRVICYGTRVAYAKYGEQPGRLSRQVAQNATRVYAVIRRVCEAYFTDRSFRPVICVRVNGTQVTCVPKPDIHKMFEVGSPCVEQAMKNTLPEHADSSIFGFDMLLKVAQNNGLLQYVMG